MNENISLTAMHTRNLIIRRLMNLKFNGVKIS